MNTIHENLTYFTEKHRDVYEAYTNYGKAVHEKGGPLNDKTRWLIKIAVSATEGYRFALQTHIKKALEAGVSEDEIEHALLLTAPTAGFPRMMEALLTYRETVDQNHE